MKTTTSGSSAVKLIWHADKLLEADWLREVFNGFIDAELTDLDQTCFDDNSIHVVSSNFRPLPMYESYFEKCRARCNRIFLFHANDEYYSGGYELYRHFDSVIRNFHTRSIKGSGILTFSDKCEFLRTQAEIDKWWIVQKCHMRAGTDPSHAPILKPYNLYMRNSMPTPYEPLRLIELLERHSFLRLRRCLSPSGRPNAYCYREPAPPALRTNEGSHSPESTRTCGSAAPSAPLYEV